MLRQITTLFLVINLVVMMGLVTGTSSGMELSHLRRDEGLNELDKRDPGVLQATGRADFDAIFESTYSYSHSRRLVLRTNVSVQL